MFIRSLDRVQLSMPPGEEARSKEFRPAKKARPAFIVENLDQLVSLCRREGYSVVDDEPLEGYFRVYIDDPFGNRLELMEPQT